MSFLSSVAGTAAMLVCGFVAIVTAAVIVAEAGIPHGSEQLIKIGLLTGFGIGVLLWPLDAVISRLARQPGFARFAYVPLRYWTLIAPALGVLFAVFYWISPPYPAA